MVLLRSQPSRLDRVASHIVQGAAMIVIEHAVTADMPDGQPLPPYIDNGGAAWCVVRRTDGRTTWRRITLKPPVTAGAQRRES
jgi:hypothetical protein